MRIKWRLIGGILILATLVFGTVSVWAANGDITVNIQDMAGNSLSTGTNVKADFWGTYWDGAAWQWFHMVKAANVTGSVTWTTTEITSATTAVPDSVYYLVTAWGGDPFANSQAGGTGGNWILYDSSVAAKNWNVRTFTTSIEGTASSSEIVFDVDLGGTVPNDSAVAVNISYEGCAHDVQPVISATTKSNMQADGYTFSFASGPGLLRIENAGTGYDETFSGREDGSSGYIAELETEALLPGVYDDVAKEFSADIDYHSVGLAHGDTFFALCYFYFTGPEAGLEVCTHNGYVGHMLHPMIVPRPSQVWVDDDYTSGSCGGHVWYWDAFDNIQDGVDAVSGSTVYVAAGTYTEHITIGKTLTLQASSSPVIDGGGSGTAVTINASNVHVTGFTIQNADTGVLVSTGTGSELHFNNILSNTTWGINNTSGNLVDAENNWWGNASGPYNAASNPAGTGDKVSDNVDYDPWLLEKDGTETSGTDTTTVTGSGTVTNTPTGGDVTINGTGDHIITTAKYASNPGGTTSFSASGSYYDVHLDTDAGVNSLTVEFCPAIASTIIYYWDGTDWQRASDQTYADGCITVTITSSTSPSLSDLTGLPFGSSEVTLGDVNGDGYVNVLDARLCLQIATAFITPTAAQEAAADVDEDGDVDMDDAELLAKYIIGMEDKLGGE